MYSKMSLISIFLIFATIFNSAFTCPFLRFLHSSRGNTGSKSSLPSTSVPSKLQTRKGPSDHSTFPDESDSSISSFGSGSTGTDYPLRGPAPAPATHDDGSQRAGGGDWENKVLQKHNELRSSHGAPPLSLDPKLSQLAQEWANKLGSKPTAQLEHRPNNEHGENIYWTSVQNADVEKGVQDWYKEKADYDPSNPDANFMKTGHFTQLVWKGSTKMGCGKTSVKTGTFLVCNYDPAGNVKGQYNQNVTP